MSDDDRPDDRQPEPRRGVSRRGFLRTTAMGGLAAGAAGAIGKDLVAGELAGQSPGADELPDETRLNALAHALLPGELTPDEREGVSRALLSWLRGYRAGETMDHGYGFTRVRETDPSPGPRYAEELESLDARARTRFGRSLIELDAERVRELAAEAIEETAPDMDSLPSRPDAPHVAIALLATYYRSGEATDRAYGKRIRPQTCRGLFTDVDSLQPYAPGIVDADREQRR